MEPIYISLLQQGVAHNLLEFSAFKVHVYLSTYIFFSFYYGRIDV